MNPQNGEMYRKPSVDAAGGELAVISSQLRFLFPAACVAVARPVVAQLSGDFETTIANERFAPARQNQFLAGRSAAVGALTTLGSRCLHVPRGAQNEPLWPVGTIGAIAHVDEIAVAVVARCSEISGLGIDLELLGAVSPDLWTHVFSPAEIKRLSAEPPPRQTILAAVAFSAKEAFFKLQFPHTRRWVDFDAAEVVVAADRCTVRAAEPFELAGVPMREVHGAYRLTQSNVLVGLWTTAASSRRDATETRKPCSHV